MAYNTPDPSPVYVDTNPGVRQSVSIKTSLAGTKAGGGISQLKNVSSGPTVQGIPKHVSNVHVRASVSGTKTNFTVTWAQDPTDTAFTGAHIHVRGYQGSTSPQRILTNGKSPAVFSLDSTSEPVTVIVQAAGNRGTANINTAPSSTAFCGKPLFGGFGTGTAALTSADQAGGFIGGGQSPVNVPTVISNSLTTGGALSQWTAGLSITLPGTLEFDVLAVSGGLVDVLLLAGQTGSNPNGYIFRFDSRSNQRAGQILTVTNGVWAVIGTAKAANNGTNLAGWYRIKAQVTAAGIFNVWVNGVLTYSATDNTYSLPATTPTYSGYEVVGSQTMAPGASWFLAKGGIPPAVQSGFTYTSTTSNITWSWSGLTIYRADGTTTAISNSSLSESSLASSTTYYYYPAYDDLLAVLTWVGGSGHGTHGNSFLSAQRSNALAQSQNLQNLVPFNAGPISAATTSSGSGGGSGGGSGNCVRNTMLVEERTRGTIPAHAVKVGDYLRNREGFVKVLSADLRDQDLFVRVTVNGHSVEVTPTHPFVAMDENCNDIPAITAARLTCMTQLFTIDGADFVAGLQVVKDPHGKKMAITCEADHTFFSGETTPYILTHNIIPS